MKKNNFIQYLLLCLVCFSAQLPAATIYLSASGSDNNDGLTPTTAVANFSRAYAIAAAGDEISVSGFIDMSTDTANVAAVKAGFFIGKSITVSGASNTTDGFTGNDATRIFHVNGKTNTITLTLKDLTFKHGKYLATGTNSNAGGALLLDSVSVIGENLIFDSNAGYTSTDFGGAIQVHSIHGLYFKNCLFSNNSGRAVTIYGQLNNATSRFENCAFISNTYSNGSGSAFYVRFGTSTGCALDFINCTFKGNSTSASGTIYLYSTVADAKVSLYNCTMSGNVSAKTGTNTGDTGGIYAYNTSNFLGTLRIYNSIIEGNTSSATSGNVLNDLGFQTAPTDASKLIIYNSFIGRCPNFTATSLPDVCYPQATNKATYFNYNVSSATPKAGLGSYNSTYHCYPLESGASAIGFGDAQWLTALSVTTDQLGKNRDFSGNTCYAGAVESTVMDLTGISNPHTMNYSSVISANEGLMIKSSLEGNYSLRLFTVSGQLVKVFEGSIMSGEMKKIQSNMNKGIYVSNLTINGITECSKIIVE